MLSFVITNIQSIVIVHINYFNQYIYGNEDANGWNTWYVQVVKVVFSLVHDCWLLYHG